MMKIRSALTLTDVVGIAGAALLAYGAWLIYRPLGFLVAGALLLAGSLLLARAD